MGYTSGRVKTTLEIYHSRYHDGYSSCTDETFSDCSGVLLGTYSQVGGPPTPTCLAELHQCGPLSRRGRGDGALRQATQYKLIEKLPSRTGRSNADGPFVWSLVRLLHIRTILIPYRKAASARHPGSSRVQPTPQRTVREPTRRLIPRVLALAPFSHPYPHLPRRPLPGRKGRTVGPGLLPSSLSPRERRRAHRCSPRRGPRRTGMQTAVPRSPAMLTKSRGQSVHNSSSPELAADGDRSSIFANQARDASVERGERKMVSDRVYAVLFQASSSLTYSRICNETAFPLGRTTQEHDGLSSVS